MRTFMYTIYINIDTVYCIWSVTQSLISNLQSPISSVSFQRNVAIETSRTTSSINICETRNDKTNAINCTNIFNYRYTYKYVHSYTYTYMCVRVCMCVCVYRGMDRWMHGCIRTIQRLCIYTYNPKILNTRICVVFMLHTARMHAHSHASTYAHMYA